MVDITSNPFIIASKTAELSGQDEFWLGTAKVGLILLILLIVISIAWHIKHKNG